jgi:uncharacterized protein (TIGR02246 family)
MMPLLKIAPAFLLLFVFTGCITPTHTETMNDAQRDLAVRMTLNDYVAGRQVRDLKAVEAVLHPEVDQLTSRGEWRRGIDAATAGMKRSSTTNPGDRTLKIETVRFLHPTVALADARYIIKGTDGAPDRILCSSFTLVKQANGNWQITSIRNQKPAE